MKSIKDVAIDIKTDFYTREGLLNLTPTLDYAKSLNFLQNTQYNNTNQTITTTTTTTTTSNAGSTNYTTANISNEPVKL